MIEEAKFTMDDFITITKALSDPHRARALFALRSGELCVCQIIELLGLAPSTVSKHLTILKQAGLVKSRKEERWMYYRLPNARELSEQQYIQTTLTWLFTSLESDEDIKKDLRLLEKITSQDQSLLCKQQRSKQ